MKRREFLRKTAGAAAAGLAIAGGPMIIPRHVLAAPGRPGANDRIQIGFVGLGGRAKWLLTLEDIEGAGAQIVAVADAFQARLDEAAKLPGGEKRRRYSSHRAMLEKEKLDAVFVETATHQRVLVCMDALQAGCDVYGEKPLTLYVEEGRALVNAVRKLGRILQTGTQQRSMPINVYASKLVRDGALGKIEKVICCNFEGPARWTPKPEEPKPAGLDWDLWCAQTELRPYHRQLHYNWANWWDYDGGGQMWGVSGWGTHSLDQVQCALGTDETGPVEIWPEDKGPTCKVTMKYANGTLLRIEAEPRKGKKPDGSDNHDDLGGIFVGEKGVIEIIRGNWQAEPKELEAELRKNSPPVLPEGKMECDPHIRNFFECMRTRKRPNADVEIGHRSNSVCHIINICRDLQRKLTWDPKAELFVDPSAGVGIRAAQDDEANKMLSRPRRKGYELPKIG
jgi:predicted dehydrogenase